MASCLIFEIWSDVIEMAESFVFKAKFDDFLVLDAPTFFIYTDDFKAF